MSHSAEKDARLIADVLAAHWEICGDSKAFTCTCGYGLGDGSGDVGRRSMDHIAAELLKVTRVIPPGMGDADESQ